MNDFEKQVRDYISGTAYTECPHPLNRIQAVNDWQDICSMCGKTVFAASFHEVNNTHGTPATHADIARMWKRLWGDWTKEDVRALYDMTNGELLDLTQI